MITNKEMEDLGFSKIKNYNHKKEQGVSSFVWSNHFFEFSIEKDLGMDDGNFFQPTLKIGRSIFRFEDINHLKKVLTSLGVIKKW